MTSYSPYGVSVLPLSSVFIEGLKDTLDGSPLANLAICLFVRTVFFPINTPVALVCPFTKTLPIVLYGYFCLSFSSTLLKSSFGKLNALTP
ncbi:Uncharacterised protein [Staphylococcus aureus]|nr:Uncharacterised protein [Staphylococcus aureus]